MKFQGDCRIPHPLWPFSNLAPPTSSSSPIFCQFGVGAREGEESRALLSSSLDRGEPPKLNLSCGPSSTTKTSSSLRMSNNACVSLKRTGRKKFVPGNQEEEEEGGGTNRFSLVVLPTQLLFFTLGAKERTLGKQESGGCPPSPCARDSGRRLKNTFSKFPHKKEKSSRLSFFFPFLFALTPTGFFLGKQDVLFDLLFNRSLLSLKKREEENCFAPGKRESQIKEIEDRQ